MLLWLIEAAGVDSGLFSQAKRGASAASTLGGQSKAIRQAVPYSEVAGAAALGSQVRDSPGQSQDRGEIVVPASGLRFRRAAAAACP